MRKVTTPCVGDNIISENNDPKLIKQHIKALLVC